MLPLSPNILFVHLHKGIQSKLLKNHLCSSCCSVKINQHGGQWGLYIWTRLNCAAQDYSGVVFIVNIRCIQDILS